MEIQHRDLPFKFGYKRVIGCALLLAGITIAAVMWMISQSLAPHLKSEKFIFGDNETIPTNSSYYFLYSDRFADEDFDASLFTMDEVGSYDVKVAFHGDDYNFQIVIEDQSDPIITFPESEEITFLSRVDGEVQTKDLFTIQDTSEATVIDITPALEEIQDGEQEICVTVQDAFEHTASKCANLNIKLIDYAIKQNAATCVEDVIAPFVEKYQLNTNNFGFFYYDVEDEETYVYSGDTTFVAASTIKVPLNMLYYDKRINGELSSTLHYTMLNIDVEAGAGSTTIDYKINQAIPLTYLLEQSIVNSDNTATNILIRNLGSFDTYRKALTTYSDATLPANFMTDNVLTPNYMLDVLTYLYEHRQDYSELLQDMKQASSGMYLQSSSDVFEIAQKYGALNANLHTIGIVYTPTPYCVGIFTDNVNQSDVFITELNKALIDYQLQKQ